MREIFAADFSDRVIHHLIYRCIYPIVDRKLIHDTYSCRVGKGTHYGMERAKKFVRSCSRNHSEEAYVLKLDIEAYFMNMQHHRIYEKVVAMLPAQQQWFSGIHRDTLLFLLQKTIYNPVKANCRMKGSWHDWSGLPPSKSLFHHPDTQGLPIGNLTSQVFGNVYLNEFDHFVKRRLTMKYYGRYVDDMILIHRDKERLEALIPVLQEQVAMEGLRIHPRKIVLKPVEEGFYFLGQVMKPYRSYISRRTKNGFYQAIQRMNKVLATEPLLSWEHLCAMQATVNSYLGILRHANTFRFRQAMMARLRGRFYDFFWVCKDLHKVSINEYFWEWHFSPSYQFTK